MKDNCDCYIIPDVIFYLTSKMCYWFLLKRTQLNFLMNLVYFEIKSVAGQFMNVAAIKQFGFWDPLWFGFRLYVLNGKCQLNKLKSC